MSDLHLATRQQLKAFVERIERLEEEKAALAGDIRDVYTEAKGTGFDAKIMRQVIRLRKQNCSSTCAQGSQWVKPTLSLCPLQSRKWPSPSRP